MNQKQQSTVNEILKGIAARKIPGLDISSVKPVWLGDRGGSVALCIGPGWPIILVGCRDGQLGLSGIETVGYYQHPYATNLEAAIYADVLARTRTPKDYKPPKGRRMPESYQLARDKCAEILKQRQEGAVDPVATTVKAADTKAAPEPQGGAPKDYKAIFDGIESTLLEVGSRNVSRDQIQAELEPCKHLEGKQFTDDEYYKMLVHIIFYSGFRAETVTEKLTVIDRHFPDYKVAANYGDRELQFILNDPQMIRNRVKVQACIENGRKLRDIIGKHGSLQNFIESFAPNKSDVNLRRLKEELQQRFAGLGEITVYHFLTDIGMPVLKPDRVVTRIFTRLGLVNEGASPTAIIEEGRKFAKATGHPIRYIDIVFVAYGQMQSTDTGLQRGICLEADPSCSVCGATKYCDYYARARRAAKA